MKVSLFDYNLSRERIAQYPVKKRGDSRLMVLGRDSGSIAHRMYVNLPEYINAEDVVVLNKTKVLMARTFPWVKRTGRKVEVLFLNKLPDAKISESLNPADYKNMDIWYCLIGRARHVKIGDVLIAGDFEIHVVGREEGSPGFIVAGNSFRKTMENVGHVPLPPYIRRKDEESDKKRYNTVFAQVAGAVAAPTASLNLTEDMLGRIKKTGAKVCYVNLTVGWGTFAPVNTVEVEDFDIHSEFVEIPRKTVNIVNNCQGRVWAFGTTVVRTLETASSGGGKIRKLCGETELFIYPGYNFKVVDVLVTNFHVPCSSLIMLVSAFAGRENVLRAYKAAAEYKYKFLSYGDSMLVI